MRFLPLDHFCGAVLAVLLSCVAALAQDVPQFSRDVLPVLAAKCFACHGPDASKRKADLRLDEAAFAFAELRSCSRNKSSPQA